MSFVAMDIGCIECGEQTECLGLFDDTASAQAAADARVHEHGGLDGAYFVEGGHHRVEVFQAVPA